MRVNEDILLFKFSLHAETAREIAEGDIPELVLLLCRPAPKAKLHQRVAGPESGMHLYNRG